MFALVFIAGFNNQSFAASSYSGASYPWSGGGCYMQVYNRRTGLYYAGVFNSNWESDLVVENGDFETGDVLDCDAYTCYAYGSYWIYKGNTIASLERDTYYKESSRHPEHLYFTVTLNTRVTKVACSAAYNSQYGEQLSVTIYSTTDETPPTVSVNSGRTDRTKVLQTQNITISGHDDMEIKGYKVTASSVQPTSGFTDFSGGTTTDKSVSYNCPTAGTYYAWVIDAYGNISDYAKFTVGTSPAGTVSAPAVRQTENTTYRVTVSSGTSPYTYQWYVGGSSPATRANVNSAWNTYGATLVSGQTSTSYVYTGNKAHNNKYVYCAVDNGYDVTFISAKQVVYFPPEVNATISPYNAADASAHVKKDGSATCNVTITTAGNPNSYTYQWYKASSLTAAGNKIVGATSASYTVRPTENQTTYFYCVVNNGQYDVPSNRVCMKADVTEPTIRVDSNSFDENIYANRNVEVTIPLIVSDTGHGYTSTSFQPSDVIVKVNGEEVSPSTKRVEFVPSKSSGTNYYYYLILKGLLKNGKLSFEIPAGGFTDDFGNGNTEYKYTSNVEIDNIDPVIYFSQILGAQNLDNHDSDVRNITESHPLYLSSKHTDLVIELYIEEKIGLEPTEFTASDIGLKTVLSGSPTAASPVGESYSKTLQYTHREGIRYYYKLTLSRIPGDGQLYVFVSPGNVRDWATNGNGEQDESADKTGQNIKVKGIIIDNSAPKFDELPVSRYMKRDGGPAYPDTLEAWNEEWSNQNIYMTVNATDPGGKIDYYTVSKDGRINFTRLPDKKDKIEEDYKNTVYYRVYDEAGNMSETSCLIKIDKTPPAPTTVLLHEERLTGAIYVFNKDKPINKTIYAIAAEAKDVGKVQSGVKIDKNLLSNYISYYEIKKYTSIDGEPEGEVKKASLNINDITGESIPFEDIDNSNVRPNAVICEEDGYYVFTSVTYDKAGNVTKIVYEDSDETSELNKDIYKEPIKMHIKKRTNNVIKLKKLDDIGSGIDRAEIFIYNGRVETPSGLLKQTTITDLFKEYTTSVTLNKGDYLVKVILYDKVGNPTEISKIISNSL